MDLDQRPADLELHFLHADAAHVPQRLARCVDRLRGERERGLHLGDLYTESGQTLQGAFSAAAAAAVDRTIFKNSAVSMPNFASKYSLELGSI